MRINTPQSDGEEPTFSEAPQDDRPPLDRRILTRDCIKIFVDGVVGNFESYGDADAKLAMEKVKARTREMVDTWTVERMKEHIVDSIGYNTSTTILRALEMINLKCQLTGHNPIEALKRLLAEAESQAQE